MLQLIKINWDIKISNHRVAKHNNCIVGHIVGYHSCITGIKHFLSSHYPTIQWLPSLFIVRAIPVCQSCKIPTVSYRNPKGLPFAICIYGPMKVKTMQEPETRPKHSSPAQSSWPRSLSMEGRSIVNLLIRLYAWTGFPTWGDVMILES